MNQNFVNQVTSQAADLRSILLWLGNNKSSLQNIESESLDSDEKKLKRYLLSEIEKLESNVLAAASLFSDVALGFEDKIILDEILMELA